jgi:hypothetical protein
VRDELVRVRAGRECDRRAERAGLLRSAGSLVLRSGSYAIEAQTEHPGVARRLFQAVAEGLGAHGEVLLLEPGRGHPNQRFVVRTEGVSLQTLVEAGLLGDDGAPAARVPRRIVAKRCCVAAYLRGAFLARGSVSDPRRGAHLEIRADEEEPAADLTELLTQVGAQAKTRDHRGWAAYVKSVGGVGTALAAMGAHDAYLAWEAGGVLKEVHVEAGRLANADAANARRLARASASQLAAIEAVEELHGLQKLPRALREIADLRRANPDASMDELGRLCTPPVTKAAVAGRLRRLHALAGS